MIAELKRTVFCTRTVLLLLIMLLLNFVLCSFQCNDTQQITLTGEELDAYIQQYGEYVEDTLQRAEEMKGLGLLAGKETYTYRNIVKTVEDFEKMRTVVPETGENRGIVIFGGFEVTDLLLAGFGLYLVLMFTGEYRKGLSLLVFSTVGGRRRLGAFRLVILFGTMFLCGALLYLGNFLLVSGSYPNADITRPLQSVPEFMKCTMNLSIGRYLLIVSLMKTLGACAAALLLFAAVSVFKNTAVAVAGGCVLFAEFLAYRLIIPTSAANGLKYLNIYAVLAKTDEFQYYNLDIMGRPVSLFRAMLVFILVLIAILSGFVLLGQGIRAPEGSSFLRGITDRIVHFKEHRKPCYPGFLWEGRKLLITQYGLIIITVIMYLAVSSSLKTEYRDFRNNMEIEYYARFGGDISNEKLEEAKELEVQLNRYLKNAYTNKEHSESRINELLAGDEPVSEQTLESLYTQVTKMESRITELEYKLGPLSKIIANMEDAFETARERNMHISLVEPFSYEMLLSRDSKTCERAVLYCLICMILVLSGIMNYEKSSGTELLLASMPRGRRMLSVKKMIWCFLIAVAVTLPIHLIQFFRIGEVFPYMNPEYPVQSIALLRDFPLQISLRTYLAGLYASRVLMNALVGAGVMFVSSKTRNRINCIFVCLVAVAVYELPAVAVGG